MTDVDDVSERESVIRDGSALAVKRIRPAYEQVADQLRQLIVSGTLVPGDRLPVEGKLSTTFGVSRSTIREALRSLSAQNLVYTSRGVAGGTFIAVASPGVLSAYLETGLTLLSWSDAITTAELLEAREVFEVPATRLAASRRTDEHVKALREAIEQQAAASDRGSTFEHNTRFHAVVLEAAGNQLAEVMISPIFGVIRSRFLNDTVPRSFWTQVDEDHQIILEHIEAQDEAAAGEAMKAHLRRLTQVYQRQEVDNPRRQA